MLIFINNKNGVPIYDQIYSQIKSQIINGTIEEDAPLPSIRSLAKDLHISVITTKRAYEELEKDGFIYTLPGKGSFVAKKNTALIKEENLRQIEEHLDEVMKLSASCGLKKEDIIEMLEILFGEEEQ
ncbi:MAG: GntR family transcriptional regulator [Eubacterium sp.]|uniref:GntR family transcriptional regulator n=1 Tax=Eubacterium sp. TaxID=142586 RepID=UPI003A20917B